MWEHMPFSKSMKYQKEADVSGEYHRFHHKFWAKVWLSDLLTQVRVKSDKGIQMICLK